MLSFLTDTHLLLETDFIMAILFALCMLACRCHEIIKIVHRTNSSLIRLNGSEQLAFVWSVGRKGIGSPVTYDSPTHLRRVTGEC